MQLPFKAIFKPTRTVKTVEAVTDTGAGRFYWVRSRHNKLVAITREAFY